MFVYSVAECAKALLNVAAPSGVVTYVHSVHLTKAEADAIATALNA